MPTIILELWLYLLAHHSNRRVSVLVTTASEIQEEVPSDFLASLGKKTTRPSYTVLGFISYLVYSEANTDLPHNYT